MRHFILSAVSLLCVIFFSCVKNNSVNTLPSGEAQINNTPAVQDRFSDIVSQAALNADLPKNIISVINADLNFRDKLFSITGNQNDPYLRILVDKRTPLRSDYEPGDLVDLRERSYRINRADMKLRSEAEASLEEMAAAARADGITLLASSAYRSYEYQTQVYNRNVRQMGQEEADRVSAKPGQSQHQLGLVVDFGSITNDFALTRAGIWLKENASRFGWSLSYPKDMEDVTGYDWESWHYRYVGRELADFIDTYFEGVQQYALRFIHEWELITRN
jgi:D-alanyl-D-alanine carboxypeptidase